jgi:hypothetical protein
MLNYFVAKTVYQYDLDKLHVGDYVEFTIKDAEFDCYITNRGIIVELTPEYLEILMPIKTAIVHSENEFFDKHHLSNNGDDALSGYRYIHLFDTYETTAWGDVFSVSIHIDSTKKLDFDIKVLSHDSTTVDSANCRTTDYYVFK